MASEQTEVLPGHWIVRLRPYASARVQSGHVSFMQQLTADDRTPFNCEVHDQFQFPEFKGYSAKFDDETKAEIEQMNEVAAIEPVQLYDHCSLVSQANAPWGLARISAHGRVGSSPYTYNYDDQAQGQDTIAYVLDTGINRDHVEFDNGRATRGPKFVKTWLDQGMTVKDEDIHGHGTHCAGTIASRAYGVAKKTKVVGIKVFNDVQPRPSATNADIIKAIEHVVSEVRRHGKRSVINLSLGGGPSPALDDAVAAAVRAGVVVCVAAGNGNADATNGSPSREPLAITVGATSINDVIPGFGNYGKIVDILAPGVNILSCGIQSNNAAVTMSGTSMASPHVAGVACCLLSNRALRDVRTSEIMSQFLIQADKNNIAVDPPKKRTINAVVQVIDQPTPRL